MDKIKLKSKNIFSTKKSFSFFCQFNSRLKHFIEHLLYIILNKEIICLYFFRDEGKRGTCRLKIIINIPSRIIAVDLRLQNKFDYLSSYICEPPTNGYWNQN